MKPSSKKTAEALPVTEFKNATIYFAIVQIKDDDVEALTQSVSFIVDLLLDHQGMMISAVPPFVIATFGEPFADNEAGKNSGEKAVEALLSSSVGSSVRVVHGTRKGSFGSVGSARFMNFSPVIPQLGDVFRTLFELKLGASKRV